MIISRAATLLTVSEKQICGPYKYKWKYKYINIEDETHPRYLYIYISAVFYERTWQKYISFFHEK